MFFLRNGAGGAAGDFADGLAGEREDGVAVAGDAAVDHFEADEPALGAACALDGAEGFGAYEVGAFVELAVAAQVGFEDVDGVGDFVAVEGHGGLEAEGVAGAEAAGEDAELGLPASRTSPQTRELVGSSEGM